MGIENMSVNKVILIGNLGNDPELRQFANGGEVANLSLATSESWKDKNTGEKKNKTEWHKVSVMAPQAAKFCGQYLKKGAKVYIEGQLETRKWDDKEGVSRYSTEVVVRPFSGRVDLLDGKSEAGNVQKADPIPANDFDDEIPF